MANYSKIDARRAETAAWAAQWKAGTLPKRKPEAFGPCKCGAPGDMAIGSGFWTVFWCRTCWKLYELKAQVQG